MVRQLPEGISPKAQRLRPRGAAPWPVAVEGMCNPTPVRRNCRFAGLHLLEASSGDGLTTLRPA
eukprot:4347765-Prymnesium_polylepis.1